MNFIKKLSVLLFALFLSACASPVTNTDIVAQPETTVAIEKTTVAPVENVTDWLLSVTLGGGPGEDEMFLTRLDDSTGESYISVQELVNELQTDEERQDSQDSYLSMGKLNSDGSRLAVYRWWDGEEQSDVEIYDLREGKKVKGFEMPGDLLDISADLTHYLYEQGEQLYVYDAVTSQILWSGPKDRDNIDETTAQDLNQLAKISPDTSMIIFPHHQGGMVLMDIKSGQSKRILQDQMISYMVQWNSLDQLVYKTYTNEESYEGDIYLLDTVTEQSKRIGTADDEFALSPDLTKMIIINEALVKVFLVDLQNGQKKDISSTVNGHGNWVYPQQWIESNVDYLKYRAVQ